MANLVYPNFLKLLASGTIDLVNDNIRVSLLSGSYTPNTGHTIFHNVSVHQSYDPLAGYLSGGSLLQSKVVNLNALNYAVFDAADVSWSSATLTASGAVIWQSGTTPATSHLIAWQDLGGNQSSTNGTFQIVWNTNGIFVIGAI